MTKTNIDDMLIEMITPKVKEIEEKFSQGKGLSQDDINTLLLKSQYNHINHLDLKLNQVTTSVITLESKFDKKFLALEAKFLALEANFDKKFLTLEANFDKKFLTLEAKFDKKFLTLETKFDKKFTALESKFDLLAEQVEHSIQKALNRNTYVLVFAIGLLLTLSKLIEKL